MTLPLQQRLPDEFWARFGGKVHLATELSREQSPEPVPGLELRPLQELLPGGGFLRGQITELAVPSSGSQATTLALLACAQAQRESETLGGSSQCSLCVFVDPQASLHVPGVVELGVRLDRLLVIQPPLGALSRVVLRLVRSGLFPLIVVDTLGPWGRALPVDLGSWLRTVRQMNLALQGSPTVVLLLTDIDKKRPISLPVGRRVELKREDFRRLSLRLARDRRYQSGVWRRIHWDWAVVRSPIPPSRSVVQCGT